MLWENIAPSFLSKDLKYISWKRSTNCINFLGYLIFSSHVTSFSWNYLFRHAFHPQETYKNQGTRLSTQNARKNLPFERRDSIIENCSTKKKKTISKDTFSAAISLENFNIMNLRDAHKAIKEGSYRIICLSSEFLSAMKIRRIKRITSLVDSHFLEFQVGSSSRNNLSEICRRNRKKRHRG